MLQMAVSIPSSETQGFKRGWEGKGETGRGKKRSEEGKGRERGNGKPWEASLYRSFLDRRANTISEVKNRFRWLLSTSITDQIVAALQFLACVPTI